MRDASICGLGQAAPNPVDCVLRYFPHELEGGRMSGTFKLDGQVVAFQIRQKRSGTSRAATAPKFPISAIRRA